MPAPGFKMHRNTPAGIARRAAGRRAKLDGLVAEMHAAYMAEGLSLVEVGRRFGDRSSTAVREMFKARGLAIRDTWRSHAAHRPDGCFVAGTPLTDAEADALADVAEDLHVPEQLKFTWRKWPLARRAAWLARVRARIGSCNDRPTTPLPDNVEFFDYGSDRAHAIARALNVGRDSQTGCAKIRANSEGVIFEGELWFWKTKIGYCARAGYVMRALHHHLWSQAHGGRAVPAGHAVRFADGDRNNLTPANLVLLTRDQVFRENQARALAARSRLITTTLLNRSQDASRHELITHLRHSAV